MRREIRFQEYCERLASAQGWRPYLLALRGITGWPDTTFVSKLGDFSVFFVEFKRPDGKGTVSSRQSLVANELTELGGYVYFVETEQQFRDVLAEQNERRSNEKSNS